MKNKKRVLVVPGAFVPVNDTVTLLSYKHLRNIEAEFDVLALSGNDDMSLLSELENDKQFKKFNIEYFCAYDDAVANPKRKNVISAWRNFYRYVHYAYQKAKSGHYDVIYTSSIPAFTHLAGYYTKKKLKSSIRWIASFSDPIYNAPYKFDSESFKEYSWLEKIGFYVYIHIFMNNRFEKVAQKYADKIIYIDEQQRDFMVQQYDNYKYLLQKSMIVPLNYISEWKLYQNLQYKVRSRQSPLIYYHFGRIYGLRKIESFLYAISLLKKEDPHLSNKIQFHQYGEMIKRYQIMIRDLDISDCFLYHDKVPYHLALTLMKESDGLLLFDTILPDDKIQPYLPSKTLEYILLKKPLIIITTLKSPAYSLFQTLGYYCCKAEKNQLKEEIKKHLSLKNYDYNYDILKFENKIATQELKKYIEKGD